MGKSAKNILILYLGDNISKPSLTKGGSKTALKLLHFYLRTKLNLAW